MSDNLVPGAGSPAPPAGIHHGDARFHSFNEPTPAPEQNPLERPLAALRRYKWLILIVAAAGAALGYVGTQFITPEYEARSTIWLQTETPLAAQNRGPIRTSELLSSGAWVELLRSYKVIDAVVLKQALYLTAEDSTDEPLFQNFKLAERFAPGTYELQIDGARKSWILALPNGRVVDNGGQADSVGKKAGFIWTLPPGAFGRAEPRNVTFTVQQPRDVSQALRDRLGWRLPEGSNFLSLTLSDPDPERAAAILNGWMDEFVMVAAQLKSRNVVEFSKILETQLQYAQANLTGAQRALEDFKVNTITLPAEGGPAAAGVAETRNPVMTSFFQQRAEFDNLRHDREAVEKTLAAAAVGTVPYEAVLAIPSVDRSPLALELRNALVELSTAKSDLVKARYVFTDSVRAVRDLSTRIADLERSRIPRIAQQIVASLRERELDFNTRIAAAGKELKQIPPRTIQEMALTRAVHVAETLEGALKQRYAEAKLAEASATADVNVHDPAVAPHQPSRNTKPRIFLMAVVAGIGAALALAILLDKIDPKFRYPHQASTDLGVSVAGIVPRFPKGGVNPKSPEQVLQLVESFRSLRMHVMHVVSAPATLAVSSAAPGDGKSLVAANLAMSFAEAGLRTLLVDGDTRRGSLHDLFDVPSHPGLTDFLAGSVAVPAIVRSTSQDRLFILPGGRRHSRSPEMLSGPRLMTLMRELRNSFDVVIFDTPPLAAGIDAYAISAAAGNMLMVVRIGKTERRLAAAKLAVADRLPINIIGTVLNGVDLRGEFQYYAYTPGYGIDAPHGELAATSGS
jgi:succinoglycan biosynthesis transport protein ExoP